MAIASAGYSTRPLAEKLGYKAGQCAAFIGLPPELAELAEAVPFSEVVRAGAWGEDLGPARRFDLIHAFTTRKAELDARLRRASGRAEAGRHDLGLLAQEGRQGSHRRDGGPRPRGGA